MTETEQKKQRYRDKIRKLREELARTEGFLKKIDRDEKDAWLKSVVTMVEQYFPCEVSEINACLEQHFKNKDAATKVPAAETAQ
jgi:hypothetical protein